MKPTTINALAQLAAGGTSVRERVALAASLLRTLSPEERDAALSAADAPEPSAHVRKAFARLTRTQATE